MNLEEIEVIIGENGKIQIHVRGIPGRTCLDSTAGLEALLGDNIASREMTPEFFDQPIAMNILKKENVKIVRK
ncbi:MAG: DUF2997 domain-containing protein [Flexilinea flocculi]|nr:DUF2997 domain-containing protein [Flexilinea flocculi]